MKMWSTAGGLKGSEVLNIENKMWSYNQGGLKKSCKTA